MPLQDDDLWHWILEFDNEVLDSQSDQRVLDPLMKTITKCIGMIREHVHAWNFKVQLNYSLDTT